MNTMAYLNETKLDISAVATSSFMTKARKKKLKVYTDTLYKINKALGIKDLQDRFLKEVISKEYHKFLLLFSKVVVETLSPHHTEPTIIRLSYRRALHCHFNLITVYFKKSYRS
jgi:hypothetical protein